MSFLVSKDLEQSYTTLSGTLSDKQRSQALEVLSKSKSSDAARLIVEMFRLTSLVPLKCQLVRSLGSFSDGRTIDFLYRLAFQKSDLIVAREAILTLGQVKHPLAIEILCFFLMSEEFPFQREVLHALGSAEVLTIQDELLSIFPRMKAEASDQRALQTYLIVLAKHGVRDIEEDLLSLLRTATQVQDSGALLNSCLLAACGLGSEIVKVALEELDLEDKTFSAELKNTVVRAVEDRLGLSLEDVVLGLTGRNRKEAVSFSLAKLRRFSADRIEEAIRAFGNEFDEETFLWLKIESFQISDQASCVQFLKQLISQEIGRAHV